MIYRRVIYIYLNIYPEIGWAFVQVILYAIYIGFLSRLCLSLNAKESIWQRLHCGNQYAKIPTYGMAFFTQDEKTSVQWCSFVFPPYIGEAYKKNEHIKCCNFILNGWFSSWPSYDNIFFLALLRLICRHKCVDMLFLYNYVSQWRFFWIWMIFKDTFSFYKISRHFCKMSTKRFCSCKSINNGQFNPWQIICVNDIIILFSI